MPNPYPVVLLTSAMENEVSKTPSPFNGIWLHRTSVKEIILGSGWDPLLNKGSIYGTAVYLSKIKWKVDGSYLDDLCPIEAPPPMDHIHDREMILCKLALNEDEIQSTFPSSWEAIGTNQTHLLWYLKDHSVVAGRGPSSGGSHSNCAIASHFLGKGIKAVNFLEENLEVVAVYDPSCIRVLSPSKSRS